MKREVLSEMRAERNSIFANVEELQAEVLDVTAELKEVPERRFLLILIDSSWFSGPGSP